MSGVPIVIRILNSDPDVVALVPAARIVGEALPQGTPLNAISVTSVGIVDRTPISPTPGAPAFVLERVQVTILGKTRPVASAILKAVRRAGRRNPHPSANDVDDVVVLLDGAGPDFGDTQSGIRIETQDFRVSYNEPA